MGLNKKKLTKAEEMKLVFSDFVEMRGNPKSKDRTFFVIKSDKKIKAFTPVFRYSPKTGRITDETEWINQKMMNSFDVFGFGYNYRDVCTLLKRWKRTLPKLNMDFEDSEIEWGSANKYCKKAEKMNAEKESRFRDLIANLAECLCYGKESDIKIWFSSEPEYTAFRFAFGQYIKKGAFYEKVDFFEYCQALSPNIAHGILKEARALGVFPEYKKSIAQKYKIGKGCGGTNTASIYGYDEEAK